MLQFCRGRPSHYNLSGVVARGRTPEPPAPSCVGGGGGFRFEIASRVLMSGVDEARCHAFSPRIIVSALMRNHLHCMLHDLLCQRSRQRLHHKPHGRRSCANSILEHNARSVLNCPACAHTTPLARLPLPCCILCCIFFALTPAPFRHPGVHPRRGRRGRVTQLNTPPSPTSHLHVQ